MEKQNFNEEYLTHLLIKIQEHVVIERANILYKNHMDNVRNLLISGAQINEMNTLYNSIFTTASTNPEENNNSVANMLEKGSEIKTLNDLGIAVSTHSNSVSEGDCHKKIIMNKNPIRFLIEKDISDGGDKFLEKKNFFIKNVKADETKKTEKRYVCIHQNCHKEYKSKENLILHIKNKHNGEKPYFCKFCGKKYSHRSGKTYHELNQHKKKENVLEC